MDVQAQLSQLSPEARAALARKIKAQLSDTESASTDHDVAIVGGGVGALTWRSSCAARARTPGFSSSSRILTRYQRSPIRSVSRQSKLPHSTCGIASDWPTL